MRSPVGHLLADLAAALADEGAAWYLFGAQAAIQHGVARLTADVDVTARLASGTSAEQLARGLERHGFSRRFAGADFMARTRVAPFVHGATSLPVDIVIAGPGLEDQFLARAATVDIEGTRVPVATAEDIVVMKVLAARPKDLEDVVAILTSVADFDTAYARATLQLLEGALGQSDLVPVFDDARLRASRRPTV
ncbi:MAG: hypothetical protein OEW19_00635 [Acidobacteriota bacterium]|nr:hypothetical protein [Acidobacteriota bacterium]